ncbi:hypothetical protein PHISCL_00738 [Aspergillus sclerotialis]|uniref:Uncharacterized protein n=1 Tax=Aspergillus sclerotialis TaxID=2070753 RepID=A0A3A3AC81_9EURO|nr:hypothetical protein PHISCL_00738 [Aspergillus sclerotialis]
MASQSTRFDLPGFTLPLNYNVPRMNMKFHNALDSEDIIGGYVNRITTTREIMMMRVMNSISDKPKWDRKVFDEEIISKWRKETAESGEDITAKMMDWIIKELQWKAGVFQESRMFLAFDPGVVKSDTAIPSELQQALKEGVRPLENVPEVEKDFHPGSDNKVIDLVHPSLFPVIYGCTHILPDKVIGRDDCLHNIGLPQLLPEPQGEIRDSYRRFNSKFNLYSRKFQWMPCDVEFTTDGCRIVSYINNLHPSENRPLYDVIEKILSRTIPLWNASLTRYNEQRIKYRKVEYLEEAVSVPKRKDGESEDDFFERCDRLRAKCPVRLPEPGKFKPPEIDRRGKIDLRAMFAEKGLQVIVKLANIELTPDKPEYDGGSWHVEGQLNEHICATAIYYYDSENITESTLSFRQRGNQYNMDEINYEQDRHGFLQQVFGYPEEVDGWNDHNVTQLLGNVSTREGRLLTFPNTLQHRVSPFSLADRSKPGHRKILAFFLVSPDLRIISSANIPPQRRDWWREREESIEQLLRKNLPVELQDMVKKEIGFIPHITMEEAKKYRLELMEERKAVEPHNKEMFEIDSFSLCEH